MKTSKNNKTLFYVEITEYKIGASGPVRSGSVTEYFSTSEKAVSYYSEMLRTHIERFGEDGVSVIAKYLNRENMKKRMYENEMENVLTLWDGKDFRCADIRGKNCDRGIQLECGEKNIVIDHPSYKIPIHEGV